MKNLTAIRPWKEVTKPWKVTIIPQRVRIAGIAQFGPILRSKRFEGNSERMYGLFYMSVTER